MTDLDPIQAKATLAALGGVPVCPSCEWPAEPYTGTENVDYTALVIVTGRPHPWDVLSTVPITWCRRCTSLRVAERDRRKAEAQDDANFLHGGLLRD